MVNSSAQAAGLSLLTDGRRRGEAGSFKHDLRILNACETIAV
jgi:hypothetical protein